MVQNEKLADLKINALNDKIETMTEALSTEKELRETWIQKYDKEQWDHT